MTEAEVIKNINALNAVCGQKDFYNEEFVEALKMGVDALEKQIEKGVYEAHFYREPLPIYRCPMCPNTSIERNQVYCQDCGQKLDWSEV